MFTCYFQWGKNIHVEKGGGIKYDISGIYIPLVVCCDSNISTSFKGYIIGNKTPADTSPPRSKYSHCHYCWHRHWSRCYFLSRCCGLYCFGSNLPSLLLIHIMMFVSTWWNLNLQLWFLITPSPSGIAVFSPIAAITEIRSPVCTTMYSPPFDPGVPYQMSFSSPSVPIGRRVPGILMHGKYHLESAQGLLSPNLSSTWLLSSPPTGNLLQWPLCCFPVCQMLLACQIVLTLDCFKASTSPEQCSRLKELI